MPLRTDIWRIGVARAPLDEIAAAGGLADTQVSWLRPGPPYTFLADPFGVWREGRLHLFAEAYDYRTRHGVIDLLVLGPDLALLDRRTVLREPWHLSYPFLFETDGELWMAPEAHRSGALTLYRAAAFPDRWAPVTRLALDTPAIDPTVFRHDGLWWLAYAPDGPQADKQGRLHLAWAEQPGGPWTAHAGNPVRVDRAGSRPGGTPFMAGGRLHLPVQDCVRTYGGAVRLLTVHVLTPDRFEAELGSPLTAPQAAAPFTDGLHTLSGCGDVTLIDVKRIDRSPLGLAIDARRWLARRSLRRLG